MKKHEKILFIEEVEDGWAKGRLMDGSKKEGLYPTNFVELVKEESENSTISPFKVKSSINRKSNSPFDDLLNKNSESKNNTNNAPLSNKPICVATFGYTSAQPDELSFKKGDRIMLISKDAGDPGWWKGMLNGKEGVFPDNFVREEVGRKTVADISVPKTSSNKVSGNQNKPKSPTTNPPTISTTTVTNTNSNTNNTNSNTTSNLTSQPSIIKDNFNKANRPKGPAGKRPPNRTNRPKTSDKNDDKDDLWNSGEVKNDTKNVNVNSVESDNEKESELKNAPLAQSRASIGERMQKISGNNPMSAAFADKAFHEKIKARREQQQQQANDTEAKKGDNNEVKKSDSGSNKPSWMDRANNITSKNKDTILLNGTLTGNSIKNSPESDKKENNNNTNNNLNMPLSLGNKSQSVRLRAQMFGASAATNSNTNLSSSNNNSKPVVSSVRDSSPQTVENNNNNLNLNTSPPRGSSAKITAPLNTNVTTNVTAKRQSLTSSPTVAPAILSPSSNNHLFNDSKKDWTNTELYELIKSQQKIIEKLEKNLDNAMTRISVLEKDQKSSSSIGTSSRNYV